MTNRMNQLVKAGLVERRQIPMMRDVLS